MLIMAEKILRESDRDPDKTDQEILHEIRQELAQKIVDEMFHNNLIKTEMFHGNMETAGEYSRICVKVRAYYPDD